MADGAVASDVELRKARTISNDPPRIGPWLFRTRAGFLALWAIAAAVVLSSVLAYEVLGPGGLLNAQSKWFVLAASTLLWLPLVLLLLDPLESLANGPRLLLPSATLAILACLTAVAVVDQLNGHRLLASLPQKTAFFAFLALVFVPRVWNAVNFAKYKAANLKAAQAAAMIDRRAGALANQIKEEKIDRELLQYRNAESLGAVLVTAVVLAIIVGAFWVGTFRSPPQMGTGLGLAIFVLVVGVFSAIVFLDWISRFRPLRSLAKTLHAFAPRMHFLVNFYDWIDAGLVRIGGHVAGADHIKTRSRYSVLGGTLACLALLGWFLEPPLGLIPVALGLLTALSLSRLWSWVEEDRNLASITQFSARVPQKVGFREDYRDETLLGFIFVLVLIPIGMMQAHEGNLLGGPLFNRAHTGQPFSEPYDFGQWLGYFGFELAKALPIVDWADIYTLGPGTDSIQPNSTIRHACRFRGAGNGGLGANCGVASSCRNRKPQSTTKISVCNQAN